MGDDGGGTKSGGELVGRTVSFLSKRDGIDKLLKLAKYLSALGVEVGAGGNGANLSGLRDLEKALSLSRKAFRLGKFLGNVNKLAKLRERERRRAELRARMRREQEQERRSASSSSSSSSAVATATTKEEFRCLVEENYFLSRRAFVLLSLVSNCSEGAYYFLDQIQVSELAATLTLCSLRASPARSDPPAACGAHR